MRSSYSQEDRDPTCGSSRSDGEPAGIERSGHGCPWGIRGPVETGPRTRLSESDELKRFGPAGVGLEVAGQGDAEPVNEVEHDVEGRVNVAVLDGADVAGWASVAVASWGWVRPARVRKSQIARPRQA
jgi:hypothetical protein